MSEEVEINQAPADKAEPEPAVDLQVASGEAVGTGVLFACLSLHKANCGLDPSQWLRLGRSQFLASLTIGH